MHKRQIQFAVVREDPEIECALLREEEEGRGLEHPRVLLPASGGCTALALAARYPGAHITLVDPNPAQLALVEAKRAALAEGYVPADWNVGTDAASGLSQCGNFEALFRQLRRFLHEFVATPTEIDGWFEQHDADTLRRAFASPYWAVAFELHFCDALLHAMFGTAATQHAPPGSYPGYFRRQLERGLLAPGAPANYFLHHIFLGRYLPDALPPFLGVLSSAAQMTMVEGSILDAPDIDAMDLIGLSNIMDWMSAAERRAMIHFLSRAMRPGALVLWRQLNNTQRMCNEWGPSFVFDPSADARRAAQERSGFYDRVIVGRKIANGERQ